MRSLAVSATIVAMPILLVAMTNHAAQSKNDDSPSSAIASEIAKLQQEANEVQRDVNRWNTGYLICVALVGLMGVAVFIANRGVIKRQGVLANLQDAILRNKDLLLRAELHDKDLKLQSELHDKDAQVAGELKDKDIKIGELNGHVAKLGNDAIEAKTAQQRVEIELNKQKERAATAEKKLLELQRQVADRDLGPVKMPLFDLLAAPPHGKVQILSISTDAEAARFAAQIESVLVSAGWSEHSAPMYAALTPFSGIQIFVSATEPKSIKAADRLVRAFLAVGIKAKGFIDQQRTGELIEMRVGSK